MKSAIEAVLCVAGFAIWTPCHAQAQTVPVVFTSDYYAQPKVLVLHALNNSGKDITGYTFITRHKNPDGTVDKSGYSSTMSDMLSMLITTQMAKDGAANNVFASAGYGIFLAGETRDTTLTGINSGSELDITAGADCYADASYHQKDEDAFKQMLAYRHNDSRWTCRIRSCGRCSSP